ncbi:unnamed protein product [Effrenium voratum]|uniref:Poly [ADP-ribose] polymerase n=1 Tax=Effrenium voratum TaxID=2562239 RepID=A0AA36HX64_9DINO|nr:unnamed protein product [Effrenium voratum]CAJ1376405.1 unnamed protein product [Effrenium voratum]CAJ1432422.1 unnamed protein product [Effrenium voratum]
MWAAIFGTKLPDDEYHIKVRFAPGYSPGAIDPRYRMMPQKWMSDTEEWEAVSSFAWERIIRQIEESFECEESKVYRQQIRRRGCLAIVSLIGLIPGFILGFLMSFLGCIDGNTGVCVTGLTFASIFVCALVGLIGGSISMSMVMPNYARAVMNHLEPRLLQLQATNPSMRLDFLNVRMDNSPQFEIRVKLKSRKECELERAAGDKVIATKGVAPQRTALAPLPQSLPSYWTNQDRAVHFRHRCEVSAETRELFQAVLDQTFKARSTRDRVGSLPKRLRLLKCHRVEDSSQWSLYSSCLDRLKVKWPACTPISQHYTATPSEGNEEDGHSGEVLTRPVLGGLANRLDAKLNEFYLMHGTSPNGALGITDAGFRLDFSGSHAGSMFGDGAYFAECSSKADEYSSAGDGIYEGVFALLLCRVSCGQMLRMLRADSRTVEQALGSQVVSSVLGDREASVGTYREFVVFEAAQIYPEYVMLYEREY